MPVDVKSYLESMKSISSVKPAQKSVSQNELKTQLLLSQLIEALSYANAMDFRQKTLNKTDADDKTGREILQTMKEQEKLVQQLAAGQKISDEQNKKLTEAIDKFYEMAGATEINYKKFAENMEKYALQNNLPEAVRTRVINDSRDAHMIGQEQKNQEKNPVLVLLKKIKYSLEDAGEMTKQYRKKLFVTLDQFREGFLEAFEDLGDKLKSTSLGDIFSEIMKNAQMAGMAWLGLSDMFKNGDFKWGQALKQIMNLKKQNPFAVIGSIFKQVGPMLKGFKTFGKLMSKYGFGKGTAIAGKMLGKAAFKSLGKQGLKKIPVIGSLLSLWMAFERWQKKDYTGAFIEVGSGIAALFPGIGTLVSIGLDLINLGRDTGAISKFTEGVKNNALVKQLSEDALLMLPIIGPIIGMNKIFKLWGAGNKAEAIKLAPKVLSGFIPGGVAIFDALQYLFNLTWNNSKDSKGKATTNAKGDRGGDAPIEGPFGDAPISWQNESGGYSPKGLTSNALQATKNLNGLLGGGLTVTSAYRDPAKMMPLWNSATPIPGSRNRKNIYGNEMADPRRSNHAKGLAVDIPKSLYNRVGPSKLTRLAKQSGFNLVYPEYSAVHLEVPKGGKVAKAEKGKGKGINAKVNLEPIAENQAVITQEGEIQEDKPMSFEDIMAKFSQFNEGMLNDPSVANVDKVFAQAESQMSVPSMESLTGVQQQQSQPPAPAPQHGQPPVQQQVVQSVPAQSQTPSMDTEINDTALALLNSVLFK